MPVPPTPPQPSKVLAPARFLLFLVTTLLLQLLILPHSCTGILLFAAATTPKMSRSSTSQNDNNDGDDSLPRIDGTTSVAKTKWLELQTVDYTDAGGTPRKWDMVTRTTKPPGAAADAVIIVPLLKRYPSSTTASTTSDTPLDTILVEQFRPPLGRTTLEFPAGLIDAGETPERAALRELQEETGYVGEACKTLPRVSRPVCMSPGVTDESVIVVVVMVDLDNPYNRNPKPSPEEGEHIVIHRVSLLYGIQTLAEEGTGMPIEGVYMFALGLELGMQQQEETTGQQEKKE
mmetsp:Transcript_80101/g.120374  ORF Transcript_80101/g.120374 Transcript_80101/m.120374 type:complete len:290 (+) Transcript_80101:32-901(+)